MCATHTGLLKIVVLCFFEIIDVRAGVHITNFFHVCFCGLQQEISKFHIGLRLHAFWCRLTFGILLMQEEMNTVSKNVFQHKFFSLLASEIVEGLCPPLRKCEEGGSSKY